MLQKNDWKLFFVSVVFGILFELSAVHYKVWTYPVSNIAGVPFWIFLMWGIMAVSVYRAGTYLADSSR